MNFQAQNLLKPIITIVFGTACLYALGISCFQSSILTAPTATASIVVSGIILFTFTIFGLVYMWVHRLQEKEVLLYACLAPVLLCLFVGACGLAGEEVRLGTHQKTVIAAAQLQ